MYSSLLKSALRLADADCLSSLSGRGGGSNEDVSSDNSAHNELAALFNTHGRDDEGLQSTLNNELNMCLFDSIKAFYSGSFKKSHSKLNVMKNAVDEYGSRLGSPHMHFALNRMRGLGYYLEGNLDVAVKYCNECISMCPRFNGSHAPGLADTLLLVSEIYDAMGHRYVCLCVSVSVLCLSLYIYLIYTLLTLTYATYTYIYSDESLHSARLCVDVALNRLEAFEKDVPRAMLGLGDKDGAAGAYLPRCLGPALDEYTAMAAAYV